MPSATRVADEDGDLFTNRRSVVIRRHSVSCREEREWFNALEKFNKAAYQHPPFNFCRRVKRSSSDLNALGRVSILGAIKLK
jgi:hypothetical protein